MANGLPQPGPPEAVVGGRGSLHVRSRFVRWKSGGAVRDGRLCGAQNRAQKKRQRVGVRWR
jgi:hypothetical protein